MALEGARGHTPEVFASCQTGKLVITPRGIAMRRVDSHHGDGGHAATVGDALGAMEPVIYAARRDCDRGSDPGRSTPARRARRAAMVAIKTSEGPHP